MAERSANVHLVARFHLEQTRGKEPVLDQVKADLEGVAVGRRSDRVSAGDLPSSQLFGERHELPGRECEALDFRRLEDEMTDIGTQLEGDDRSEEHTSELQSQSNLVCRLLLEKK